MSKDNIIQFPKSRMASSRKSKLDILQNRAQELQVENEYINNDLDYLSAQLEDNLRELEIVYKKIASMHQEDLEKQLVEFKSEFGVQIDFDFEPDDNKPEGE